MGHVSGMEMPEAEVAEALAGFIPASKTASVGIKWRQKGHPDYTEASFPVFCPDQPMLNARVVMTAHRSRMPKKYGFALLVGGYRVLGLDVNPACYHINIETLETVGVTHWQNWPDMDAHSDERDLSHRQWFGEFMVKANLSYSGTYEAPPFAEPQLQLL